MIEDYRKALRRGRRQVSSAIAEGRHPYPPSLDEVLNGGAGAGEVPVGVREIPLELVVGTRQRGRSNMFSYGFMPIADVNTEFASKWSSLYDSQAAEGIRDPIVVYEYLQRFYVQEGNKRTSVLCYLNAPTILASITRVMPAPSNDKVIRHYHEFVRFYRVAPVYGLILGKDGAYEKLAALLGQTLDEPWPDDLVRDLAASLRLFTRAYRSRGGDMLGLSVGDAFMIYMRAYATSKALGASAAQMDSRVGRLWGEFVVSAHDDSITYIERLPDRKKGIFSSIKENRRGLVSSGEFRMAFVYDRNPATSGWTALHERGRLDMQRRLGEGVETCAWYGKSKDDDFDAAVRAAIADNDKVIITTSPRQMEQTRRMALAHPTTVFINCSLNLTSHAVRTFYARMYEVKFLMGALAASIAQNHRVGYLANSPIFGSVAEINAFAIGVSMVDACATVYLKWISAEGYDWKRELRESDVRVLAGRDYPNPEDPDEPYGLTYMHGDGTVERIATPVWDWGRYYELIARSIQDDSWRKEASGLADRAINYWWGLSEDVVRMELATGIPTGSKRLVRTLRQALVDGRLHPFQGELVAQRGIVVQEEGDHRLSNEEIATMRWLNENVDGRLPKKWELSRDGTEAVAVSGVITAETDAEES